MNKHTKNKFSKIVVTMSPVNMSGFRINFSRILGSRLRLRMIGVTLVHIFWGIGVDVFSMDDA